MNLHKVGLAAAVAGAAIASGWGSQAQAAVVGYASLNIYNFVLSSDGPLPPFVIFPNDATTAQSTLNGSTIGSSDPVDVLMQCQGNCAPIAENSFGRQTPFTSATFSRGDALLQGSIITALGAQGQGVAEVQLGGDAMGNAGSTISTTSAFSFQLPETQTIRADFSAIPLLFAAVSDDAVFGSTASAGISFSISITNAAGDDVFVWSPNGAVGGIIGGTEIADGCNLTRTIPQGFPGNSATYNPTGASFETGELPENGTPCEFAAAVTLDAGNYTLTIKQTQLADGRSIPEPATLALLASGLLGLGALSRRRRK